MGSDNRIQLSQVRPEGGSLPIAQGIALLFKNIVKREGIIWWDKNLSLFLHQKVKICPQYS